MLEACHLFIRNALLVEALRDRADILDNRHRILADRIFVAILEKEKVCRACDQDAADEQRRRHAKGQKLPPFSAESVQLFPEQPVINEERDEPQNCDDGKKHSDLLQHDGALPGINAGRIAEHKAPYLAVAVHDRHEKRFVVVLAEQFVASCCD